MRLLVCGSRRWVDSESIIAFLDTHLDETLNPPFDPLVIIEGEARGADTFAKRWAESWIIHNWWWGKTPTVGLDPYPADWDRYPKAAGPIRNAQMLRDGKPDFVVAFSDDLATSKGTADMVTKARKAGIPTILVGHP